ncbi:hypothetical protein NQ315_001167 [Exocentrus adspersus]|uniref:RNase H type-1 domain-containing protein n=1 Tax=Exocentrus adspersus TaxID=1586481 RepID=A0AAV8WF77_9CUCU|nr:hypothetical protein NQ315_001167 [Exocentrus adspersus]
MNLSSSLSSCTFSFTGIKLVLSAIVTLSFKMTEAAAASQLEALIRRLNEAERRAKLLKIEVKSIRREISALQQNVPGIRNGIAGTSDLLINSTVILLDDTPNTTTVDAPLGPLLYRRAHENNEPEAGPSSSKKLKTVNFNKDDDYVVVYTDGACENNGKANAKAGIGVWFGDAHPLNVSEPVVGRPTNNTAEIQACVKALNVIREHGETKAKIFTDSEFTINCITKWMKNWKKNNWKTSSGGAVKNKEDLEVLDKAVQALVDVKWVHVRGHSGFRGNEEADRLAQQGASRYKKS